MMENKRDWLSVTNSTFLGVVWLLFVGMITMPLEKTVPPFGYLFRFLTYMILTFWGVRSLAKGNGLTLQECRVTKIRLHPLGLFFTVLFPVIMIVWKIHGEPGRFVYNEMSFETALEIVFYLMFHTGFCSGIVEEVMFRGVLTRICEDGFGKRVAWILPTFFFVLPHLRNIQSVSDFLNTCLFMTAFSIFLTALTYRTGTVWDAVFIHAFWDMFAARNCVVAVSSEVEIGAFFTYVLEKPEMHPLLHMKTNEYMWLISAMFLVCTVGVILTNRVKKDQ